MGTTASLTTEAFTKLASLPLSSAEDWYCSFALTSEENKSVRIVGAHETKSSRIVVNTIRKLLPNGAGAIWFCLFFKVVAKVDILCRNTKASKNIPFD